jgi:hypothetical protein
VHGVGAGLEGLLIVPNLSIRKCGCAFLSLLGLFDLSILNAKGFIALLGWFGFYL